MENETPIYRILMLEKPVTFDQFGWPEYGREEDVGFYYEEETALKAARENWADINECGSYQALLVEKLKPGLYPIAHYCGYFVWNKKTQQFDEQIIPEQLRSYSII